MPRLKHFTMHPLTPTTVAATNGGASIIDTIRDLLDDGIINGSTDGAPPICPDPGSHQ